jgi:hypothetical protein
MSKFTDLFQPSEPSPVKEPEVKKVEVKLEPIESKALTPKVVVPLKSKESKKEKNA